MKLKEGIMEITIEGVLSWHPCEDYQTRMQILAITGGRESLSPIEVLDLNIPINHRFWVLLRKPLFTAIELRLLACDFAFHVLPIWEDWASKYLPEYLASSRDLIEIVREYPDQPGKWTVAKDVAFNAMDAIRAVRDIAWIAWDTVKAAGEATGEAWDTVRAVRAAWDATGAARAASWSGGSADWNLAFDVAWSARDAAVAAAANKNDETKWQIGLIRKKLEVK
jgi:hypothetical protein